MSETLLAFDYGERYMGIAVGDTETGLAHPAGHYQALRDEARYTRAEALVREWRPARLVVGLPLGAEGEEHLMSARARRFARRLAARTGLGVTMVDERLSSAAARETLRATGRGGRRHKNETHALAAQVILQAYLDEMKIRRMNTGGNPMNAIKLPDVELLCEELLRQLKGAVARETAMIGIATGGAWLAERLHRELGMADPLGVLDISFYRDDFDQKGLHHQVKPSRIPFDVQGRHIVLVDDVLYTGRTVRAAMNELFDYGRPSKIELAVLVDRGGRELPIAAQYVGGTLSVPEGSILVLDRSDAPGGAPGALSLRLSDQRRPRRSEA